jgi:acyl-CoA thioester hydrolase
MRIEFEGAAHIDDLLTVTTRVAALTGARLHLEQTISRVDTVLTRADVTVVAIRTNGRPARMPATIRAALGT